MEKHAELIDSHTRSPPATRRSFVAVAAAVVTGGDCGADAAGRGRWRRFFTPLFRQGEVVATVRVALLDRCPTMACRGFSGGGRSRGRVEPLPGAADRRRVSGPHRARRRRWRSPPSARTRGASLATRRARTTFKCPCHTSAFKLDGSRVHGDAEVAPRDMDTLPVDDRSATRRTAAKVAEVWVEFIDFQTGSQGDRIRLMSRIEQRNLTRSPTASPKGQELG